MLEINELSKKFGKKLVLNQLNYQFNGGVYGLLGPNGAGKTTLMRCVMNLYNIKSGTVMFDGKSVISNKEFLNTVGYLPQKFGVFKDLTVKEQMLYFANMKNIPKSIALAEVEKVLELVNLSDRINSKVGKLSGGMIRRLGIAQALLDNPKIIIFDEPTAGLDPEERMRFKNIINKMDKEAIVIISTHIVEDVEAVCKHVVVMNEGKIVEGGTSDEISKKASKKVFEIEKKELESLTGKYYIEKEFEREEKIFVRILSSVEIPGKEIQPTIEDGYLCILKEI